MADENTGNGNSPSLTFADFVTKTVCALWIREAKEHKYLPSAWSSLLPTTLRSFSGKMMDQESPKDEILEAIKAFNPEGNESTSRIVKAVMSLVPPQREEDMLPLVRRAVREDMQVLLQAFSQQSAPVSPER
ncbi:MAG: hypothetical protein ACKO43_03090 [Alphaproteobacteria bacterium]